MSRLIKPTSGILKNFSSSHLIKISRCASSHPNSAASISSEQALLNVPSTRLTILDNGLRVATEDYISSTATVGLWINAGSRSETEENNGVAHFLELMAFKGTKNRSQTDLELEVENLGAHLNAYTSREETVYYAKCFSHDVPKAVSILSDIVQNMKLDENEIESQKGVILRQMQEEQNNKQKVILDHLHSVAFQGTSLGPTTLGSTKSIMSMTPYHLKTFYENCYQPGNIVLVGAGGVDHDSLVKLAEEHFNGMKMVIPDDIKSSYGCRYTGSDVNIRDETMPLCYVAIAVEGVDWNDDYSLPLKVASTLIGSWDRTHGGSTYTAANLARYSNDLGLCHSFQSFNINYKGTGLWGIYFVCDPASLDDFRFNIISEWKRLCTSPTNFEIERAKNALRTELCMQLGNTTATCTDIGQQILRHGRRCPISELDHKIQAITASEVREACYEHIYNKCPVVAAHGNIDIFFDYSRLRADLYWFRL